MAVRGLFARLIPAFEVVQRSSLGQSLGRERMFFNVQTAVEGYLTRQTAPA